MRPTRRDLLAGAAFSFTSLRTAPAAEVYPPAPYGPAPAKAQMQWAAMEYYNFLHFTVNTFTGKEWGEGDEDPAIFNPSAFDADAIVAGLKSSGSKGVILTCKHHDGFCLWPTETTDHSIKNSPYKNGKGDIVRELSDAAGRAGLKFGIYVSPWDRNNAAYGKPEYLKIYRQQVAELLTRYGPVFEIWHDGANGGSGYYGGARETRKIDKLHYYDWANTWKLERELQPGAMRFSDVGPDIRWVGNEKGIAGETCWATFTPRSPSGAPGAPGDVVEAELTTGTRRGAKWMPAECDVSIRPGWFYHAKEDNQVRTVRNLLDLYYESVGRGASFLLNVPPDRRGLLAASDLQSLQGFGKAMEETFAKNLAGKARAHASNVRGRSKQYAAKNLLDGQRNTYWSTEDGQTTATVTFELAQEHADLRVLDPARGTAVLPGHAHRSGSFFQEAGFVDDQLRRRSARPANRPDDCSRNGSGHPAPRRHPRSRGPADAARHRALIHRSPPPVASRSCVRRHRVVRGHTRPPAAWARCGRRTGRCAY